MQTCFFLLIFGADWKRGQPFRRENFHQLETPETSNPVAKRLGCTMLSRWFQNIVHHCAMKKTIVEITQPAMESSAKNPFEEMKGPL